MERAGQGGEGLPLTGPEIHLPYPDVNIPSEVARIDGEPIAFARRFPDIELTGGDLPARADEVEPWAKRTGLRQRARRVKAALSGSGLQAA